MLREATYPPDTVNVLDVSSESMAAFHVFMYGRFWVFTEASWDLTESSSVEGQPGTILPLIRVLLAMKPSIAQSISTRSNQKASIQHHRG